MKCFQVLIGGILLMILMIGCGSNKELQQRAPAQFQQPYYIMTQEGMELHLPVSVIQENRLSLDQVYFRGLRATVVQDEEQPNLYIAQFATGGGDRIMHEDPEREYGNRAPQKPEESPFKIEDDEAILEFTQNDETKYYKLTGIAERN